MAGFFVGRVLPARISVAPYPASPFVAPVARASRILFPLGLGLVAVGVFLAGNRLYRRATGVTPPASAVQERPSANPGAVAQHTPPKVAGPRAAPGPAAESRAATDGRVTLEKLFGTATIDRAQLTDLLRTGLAELPPAERNRMIEAVGEWLGRQQLGWTDAILGSLDEYRDRYALVKAVVESLSTRDLPAAASWSSQLKDPALRDGACNVVAMQWAAKDIDAAVAWADGLPVGAGRTSAFEGLAWSWTQTDPKAAYEWASKIEQPQLRDDVLVKMAKMLAVKDGKTATEWAQQFPEGMARDNALHYAVFQWAAQDLTAAATWVAQISDPKQRTETELAVARSWATYEGQGATTWAATIADPGTRRDALGSTLQKWAQTDPAAAAQWITQNGSADAADLFRTVTAGLLATNPAMAERWVNGTTDSRLRGIGQELLAQRSAAKPKTTKE